MKIKKHQIFSTKNTAIFISLFYILISWLALEIMKNINKYGGEYTFSEFSKLTDTFIPLLYSMGIGIIYALIIYIYTRNEFKKIICFNLVQFAIIHYLLNLQSIDLHYYLSSGSYLLYAYLIKYIALLIHLLIIILIIINYRKLYSFSCYPLIKGLLFILPFILSWFHLIFITNIPWQILLLQPVLAMLLAYKYSFLIQKTSLINKWFEKNTLWVLAIIFIACFLSRLPFIWHLAQKESLVGLDGVFYHLEAKSVLNGHLPGGVWAPGFILFLSSLYLIKMSNFVLVGIVQIIINSATIVILYQIGRKLFNHNVGLLAAFLGMIDGRLLFYSHYYGPENLLAWATTAIIYLNIDNDENYIYHFMLSLISVLLKPIMIGVVILLDFINVIGKIRKAKMKLFISFLGLFVGFWGIKGIYTIKSAPYHMINQYSTGDWFAAWNPFSNGKFNWIPLKQRVALKNSGYAGQPYESERSFYNEKNDLKSLVYAVHHPVASVQLVMKKIKALYLERPDYHREFDPVLLAVGSSFYLLGQGYFCMVWIMGWIYSLKLVPSRIAVILLGLPIYFTLLHALTWAKPRYRVPLEPVLVLLCAVGLSCLLNYMRTLSRQLYKPEGLRYVD